jgi:hypothetical protein
MNEIEERAEQWASAVWGHVNKGTGTECMKTALLAERRLAFERVAEIARPIQKLLISASVGSCTCGVKSPNIVYHEAGCRYVTLQMALEKVEQLLAEIDQLPTPPD